MCGIAGHFRVTGPPDAHILRCMLDDMTDRGPDAINQISGVGASGEQVALGATRLAVVDLTDAGNQPLLSASSDVALVMNGMIYNFEELRATVGTYSFKGRSDTEVVLALYLRFGLAMLPMLRGMFALAIHDRAKGKLILARDRFGIKPLFVASHGADLFFASQVKTLIAAGALSSPSISRSAIRDYLTFGSVQDPRTIIEGIDAVPAGHFIEVSATGSKLSPWFRPSPRPLRQHATSWSSAVAQVGADARDAIAVHYRGDVPALLFLSGGVDSTALLSMASASDLDISTASLLFPDTKAINEEVAINRVLECVAPHQHYATPITRTDMLGALTGFFDMQDQPSIDGLNSHLVARVARDNGFKVAISGIGGDELMDGYATSRRSLLLAGSARMAGPFIGLLPVPRKDKVRAFRGGQYSSPVHALRGLLAPDLVAAILGDPEIVASPPACRASVSPHHRAYLWEDLYHYTSNTLLRDADSQSSGHSVELRVPLLDNQLVDTVDSFPTWMRLRAQKALLRQACLPSKLNAVIPKAKKGFALPYEDLLLSPHLPKLAEISEALADELQLERTALHAAAGTSWRARWALFSLHSYLASL